MNGRSLIRGLVAATVLPAATGFVVLAGAGDAYAAANTACPAGFETITVVAAVSAGYLTTPVNVDANGNGDGVVCRRALGDGVFNVFPNATVATIYEWMDNVTPRHG